MRSGATGSRRFPASTRQSMRTDQHRTRSPMAQRHLRFLSALSRRRTRLGRSWPNLRLGASGGHRRESFTGGHLGRVLLRPPKPRITLLTDRRRFEHNQLDFHFRLNRVDRIATAISRRIERIGGGLGRFEPGASAHPLMPQIRHLRHHAVPSRAAEEGSHDPAAPLPRPGAESPMESIRRSTTRLGIERLERNIRTTRTEVNRVRRVMVKRASTPAGSPTSARGTETDGSESPRTESGSWRTSAPRARDERSEWPPAEVNRITDQVVAAIDRRILAHRERMGRT